MTTEAVQQESEHPFLSGNFAPVHDEVTAFGSAAATAAAGAGTDVRAACRRFAAGHTWQRRAEDWLRAGSRRPGTASSVSAGS